MATNEELVKSLMNTCKNYNPLTIIKVDFFSRYKLNILGYTSELASKLDIYYKHERTFTGYQSLKQKCILLILQDRGIL